jgi:DNA end-binding protein Ku
MAAAVNNLTMYKGAISFGLVYIPITLTAAVRENDIGFNMLEKNTLSRVKYKKTCVDCGGREIPQHEIVKGYQYEKDKYVVFTDEDFENLKTPRDKDITILKFVNLESVDPVYFDRAYYVTPTGGERAYALLLAAMERENRAGLAKTVLGTRETLVLLRARGGVMLANTLYFHNEIQRAPAIGKPAVGDAELELAVKLIDNMTADFSPERFRDEYNDRLRAAIAGKIAGKEIEPPPQTAPDNIINIMDALKKSVEMSRPRRAAARAARRS